MNKSKANFFNAHNLTLLAILIALVVVLQLFASSIPMFGITLNFALIPIVLAGILLGVAGGSIVGFACGLVVFITTAVLGQEPATAFLFQTNPVVLTLICIGKTTVAGAVCGLMFWWLKRYNVYLAVIISAFIVPIMNTGVYMLGMVLMKGSVSEFLALDTSSAGVVFGVVFGIIWLNFVLELAVTGIFAPVIYRVLKAVDKKGLVIKKDKVDGSNEVEVENTIEESTENKNVTSD